jgi:hypothetical protein
VDQQSQTLMAASKYILIEPSFHCLLTASCKVEASMCNLRGILMLKLNRGDQAKLCFMEALALDVKCYDAFEQLISGEMMTPDEGTLPIFPRSSVPHILSRVGICPRAFLRLANSTRCRFRTTHIHCPSTQVQTRYRARPYPPAASGRIRARG